MRRYLIEVLNPDQDINWGYVGTKSMDQIAKEIGLKNIAFITYITNEYGATGAVYEMLDANTDEEFTFAFLKLNGRYIGRTAVVEGENFPEWIKNEPTFKSLYVKMVTHLR